MLIGPNTMVWEPSTQRGLLTLPGDVQRVDMRSPSRREALWINGRVWIIECTSSEGDVQLAVMPNELGHVLVALEQIR